MPSRAPSDNKCDVDGQETILENHMELKLTCVSRSHFAISRRGNCQKTCSDTIIFENRMALKLTRVNRSCLAISGRGNAVMPSQAPLEHSSGNKCDVDAQKTCSNAIIFENRMGLKLTCVNRSSLAISSTESATMFNVVGQVSQCLKRRPCPNLFSGIIIFNGEDIFVRI